MMAVPKSLNQAPNMKDTTKRSILRWIHIIFVLPIAGYIYGPPSETVQYLPYFRFVYFPVVMLSGLWMWKGHVIRRLFSSGPDDRNA
jgi:hypothetical protein